MREIRVGLRLPVGDVTVLLGPAAARRRVMAALDDDSGRCASGHSAVRVHRLAAAARRCTRTAECPEAQRPLSSSSAAIT